MLIYIYIYILRYICFRDNKNLYTLIIALKDITYYNTQVNVVHSAMA